jgi:REase_MTES_1575
MDVDRIAAVQHGLITTAQLQRLGVPRATLHGWRAAGRLIRVQPRVDRVAGAPVTWEQQVLAAVLSAGRGAAASHRAAGRIWGLYQGEAPVEIVVPTGRSARLRGAIVHHTINDIPVIRRTGIPATSPMRTIIDLGAVATHSTIEDALDRALIDKVCTLPAVEWELARVARPGRNGAGVLHRVLDQRALADQRPDGLLEPRFARLVRRFGLPMPEFQYAIGPYRVDFAYPQPKVAIEVDGYSVHGARRAFQDDRTRQNAIVALGWSLLRFTWEDVVSRPSAVADVLTASAIKAA